MTDEARESYACLKDCGERREDDERAFLCVEALIEDRPRIKEARGLDALPA